MSENVKKKVDKEIDKALDKTIDKIVDEKLDSLDEKETQNQKEANSNKTEEKSNKTDFQKYKMYYAFAYVLFFIPFFIGLADKDKNAGVDKMFYVNQGFLVFLCGVVSSVILFICGLIANWLYIVVGIILWGIILAGILYGLIKTLQDHEKTELPFIGKIKIFK